MTLLTLLTIDRKTSRIGKCYGEEVHGIQPGVETGFEVQQQAGLEVHQLHDVGRQEERSAGRLLRRDGDRRREDQGCAAAGGLRDRDQLHARRCPMELDTGVRNLLADIE